MSERADARPAGDARLRDEGDRHLGPLDLLVYAPAGLILTVVEDLPYLAARGRRRIDRQIRSARAVGKLAVHFGGRDLRSRLGGLSTAGETSTPTTPGPRATPPPVRVPPPPPAPPTDTEAEETTATRIAAARRVNAAGRSESRPTVDLAIPGYDALSASQVVRRLDSLGPAELEAVERHEAATRGRRTILHRVHQLQEDRERGLPAEPAD
ncbi:MAG TPA: hypothetical protein VK277_04080 [Acidimicrobiales bacterium]|nr:hypothetical protein [Acidimicrobiales bacterium]